MCAIRGANVSKPTFSKIDGNACTTEESQGRLKANGKYHARQLTVGLSTYDERVVITLDFIHNRTPCPIPLSLHSLSFSQPNCSAISAQSTSSKPRSQSFDLVVPQSSAMGCVCSMSYRVQFEGDRFLFMVRSTGFDTRRYVYFKCTKFECYRF